MRLKNKHPITPEELMAFWEDQLDPHRRRTVAEHLKICPECQTLLEGLQLAEQELARAEQVEAPEGYFDSFASRVANRIAGKRLAPARRPWLLRWGWLPAAATAALALVLIFSHELYRTPPVYESAQSKVTIPIPIAPEPRSPEELYREELVITSGQAPDTVVSPQPFLPQAGASHTPEVAAQRLAAEPPEATDRQLEDKKSKSLVSATGRPAASAPSPQPVSIVSAEPPKKSEAEEARDATSASRVISTREADQNTPSRTIVRKILTRKIPRQERFYQPQDDDTCSPVAATYIQVVVIHLPDGGQTPPPQVEPALVLRLAQ